MQTGVNETRLTMNGQELKQGHERSLHYSVLLMHIFK